MRLRFVLWAAAAAAAAAEHAVLPPASPQAFRTAARALLQTGVQQSRRQRRLLSETAESAASTHAATLEASLSSLLDTLDGGTAATAAASPAVSTSSSPDVTDFFKQIPILGSVLTAASSSASTSTSTSSSSSSDALGELLEQLLTVRDTTFSLYENLLDVETAWRLVPVLSGEPANLTTSVSTDSAAGSGIFGIRGILESLASSESAVDGLAAIDTNALESNAAGLGESGNAFADILGTRSLLSMFASTVSRSSSSGAADSELKSMAAAELEQTTSAIDLTSELQGTIQQLIQLFSGGVTYPLKLAVDSVQNAVQLVTNVPNSLGSYRVLARSLSELMLDIRGVAYGYDMSSSQSGILGNLLGGVTEFLNWLGQITSEVLNQGFFETLNKHLTNLADRLMDFDAEPIYARLQNAGLDMSFSISNRGALMSQTSFQTSFPLITRAFGLTVEFWGNLLAGGAQLVLNFAGFGLNALLTVARPFFRLASTGLEIFRGLLQLVFLRIPAMLMDSLGITSFLRAMQNTFRNAIGSLTGQGGSSGPILSEEFAALDGLDGLLSTDLLESLLLQGSASVDDTIAALAKSVGLAEGLEIAGQLSDVLTGSASRVADVLSWPVNLLSDFMTAGMSTVLGTVTGVLSNASMIGINSASGLINLITGGIFSTVPTNWITDSTNGLFSQFLGGSRRRLLEKADATTPPGVALEVAAAGVIMVLAAVVEIGNADVPCVGATAAAEGAAAARLLNAAAIAGNPARLLNAAGIDEASAEAILSLAPEATAAAAAEEENAGGDNISALCEAQRSALQSLGRWAAAGIETMELLAQAAHSDDVAVVESAAASVLA